MSRRRAATVRLMAVLAAAALAVAGCTTLRTNGSGEQSGSSVVVRPQPVPPTPTGVPTYSQFPVPASVANDPDKRSQVKIDGCASTGSAAVATGTVHNDGTRSSKYDITVFFTSSTATAVNYATASVTVAGKASATFTAQTRIRRPGERAVRPRRRQLTMRPCRRQLTVRPRRRQLSRAS